MGFFAPGRRGLAEPCVRKRKRISKQADMPRWRRSILTFALLAPLPGGLVVWFLVGWLRGRIQAW